MLLTSYEDNFAHQLLPPLNQQPEYVLELPQFQQADYLNCAEKLLDKHIAAGNGEAICLQTEAGNWTYKQLFEKANQIASVLVDDMGLVSGNRVLLRSANNPMMVACWFGVVKAGGIAISTMPLLREKELNTLIDCAKISHAFCDERLADELTNSTLKTMLFDGLESKGSALENAMKTKSTSFKNYKSSATDICLIGFTSGTTGLPKMTAHYHRDIINICEAFPPYSLQSSAADVFAGSPPIGFTFGLGGLVLFPFYVGASTFLIEKPSPESLLAAIEKHKVTICFTAPTAWRIMETLAKNYNLASLRKCISAGASLPLQVWQDWYNTTKLKIIDGIGATEMLHIFISSNEENMKPGATGVPITGYQAKILAADGNEAKPNEPGKLAVKGITGCRYLGRPEKQAEYIENGWNITGDIYKKDEEGYYYFVARGDDMIISAGYNIAAIEVESVLLSHPQILECAVIGLPDAERGMLVCAHIVLRDASQASEELKTEIQNWFKANAAPYKYPRAICFIDELPKTETGKVQRFKLKS